MTIKESIALMRDNAAMQIRDLEFALQDLRERFNRDHALTEAALEKAQEKYNAAVILYREAE